MDRRQTLKETTIKSMELGGGPELVARRLRAGWTLEEATTIPPGVSRLQHKNTNLVVQMHQEGKTYKEICELTNLSYNTVVSMLEKHYVQMQKDVKLSRILIQMLEADDSQLQTIIRRISAEEISKLSAQFEEIVQKAAMLSSYTEFVGRGSSPIRALNDAKKAAAKTRRSALA